jgi:multicopper oxidase
VIQTFIYNDRAPGPVFRLREGRQVSIDIRNDTDIDDIVQHWHELYVPSDADGAMEEGSPMVERGGTRRYTFVAKPTGTRWYHSHDVAGMDLTRSLYAGLWLPDRRAVERSRPLRPGSAAHQIEDKEVTGRAGNRHADFHALEVGMRLERPILSDREHDSGKPAKLDNRTDVLSFGLRVPRVLVRACNDVDRSGKECFKRLPAAFKIAYRDC